jgi:hypothetical protein
LVNPTTLNLYLALLLLSILCCICYREVLFLMLRLLEWLMSKLHWAVRKQEKLK